MLLALAGCASTPPADQPTPEEVLAEEARRAGEVMARQTRVSVHGSLSRWLRDVLRRVP
jgi:hypothetical protein